VAVKNFLPVQRQANFSPLLGYRPRNDAADTSPAMPVRGAVDFSLSKYPYADLLGRAFWVGAAVLVSSTKLPG
jgi:hypothetical protein